MLTGVFGGMTLPSAVEYRSLEGNLHRSRTSPVALSSSDFISLCWMLKTAGERIFLCSDL